MGSNSYHQRQYRESSSTSPNCAPSRTRTCGLLLRRQNQTAAGRCSLWPDVPITWDDISLKPLEGAYCLRSLAPILAPRPWPASTGTVSNRSLLVVPIVLGLCHAIPV